MKIREDWADMLWSMAGWWSIALAIALIYFLIITRNIND